MCIRDSNWKAQAKALEARVVSNVAVNPSSENVTLKIWDDYREDGDIITLRLNGKVLIKDLEVTKEPTELTVFLMKKENIIEFYAENVGSTPPNSASISVISEGEEIKSLLLKSDADKSKAIKITIQ